MMNWMTKGAPKNLEECRRPDEVVNKLISWAQWLESIRIPCVVIGVIIAIISAVSTTLAFSYDALNGFLIFNGTLLGWAIIIVCEYFFYTAAALLIKSHASLVYNTGVNANIAVYNEIKKMEQSAPEKKEVKEEKKDPPIVIKEKNEPLSENDRFWTCSKCGTKNANRSKCWSCGESR